MRYLRLPILTTIEISYDISNGIIGRLTITIMIRIIIVIRFPYDQVVEGYFNGSPSNKKDLRWIKGADHPLTNEKHNEEYTQLMATWFKETL